MRRLAPRKRGTAAGGANRAAGAHARRASLTIRVDFGAFGSLGPGKVRLIELIVEHGSIRRAGKEMGMSYRRAWLLVDEINKTFREPLVMKQMGGAGGGGAHLSELGRDVFKRYRAIEHACAKANAHELAALRSALAREPVAGKSRSR